MPTNTIKQDFKEKHLVNVQRGWIRKPFTISLFLLLIIVMAGVALFDAVVEWADEIRTHWSYAKQCWKGRND